MLFNVCLHADFPYFRNKGKLVTFHGTESDIIWPDVKKYLVGFSSKKVVSHA